MAQTIKGNFEQASQAADAEAYLIANGFDSELIEIDGHSGSNAIITVYTTDEDQTRQAMQVLDNFGAIDMDNFVQSEGSWDADTPGNTSAEVEYAEEANAPLDTDLINTDFLNTDILEHPTSENDAHNGGPGVVDRPGSGAGQGSTNNSNL